MNLYAVLRRARLASRARRDPCVVRFGRNRELLCGGEPPRVIVFPNRAEALRAFYLGDVDVTAPVEIISIVRWQDRPEGVG